MKTQAGGSRTGRPRGGRIGLWVLTAALAGTVAGVWAPLPGVDAAARGVDAPAQPAPTPEVFVGELRAGRPGCAGVVDATLEVCDSHDLLWVQANGLDLRRVMYRTVRIEGFRRGCGNERYIDVQKVEQVDSCDGAARGPQKANLSLRRPVVAASTELPGYPKDRITDDDPLTYWYTPSQDGWIYIDLGQALTFNESHLLWAAQHATQYGIYVWDDGYRNWVRVFQSSDGEADEAVSFARAYGRYVLLHLARSSDQAGGFALREWRLFGVETPNLALGQELTASSNGADAGLAADGNTSTGWTSEAATDRTHPWIWVRFNGRTRLSEFRLLWDGGGIPGAYFAGFYQDGKVAVWSDRLISSADPRHRLAWRTPIATDVFLIMVDQLRGPSARLMELELYGPDVVLSGDAPVDAARRARLPFDGLGDGLDRALRPADAVPTHPGALRATGGGASAGDGSPLGLAPTGMSGISPGAPAGGALGLPPALDRVPPPADVVPDAPPPTTPGLPAIDGGR